MLFFSASSIVQGNYSDTHFDINVCANQLCMVLGSKDSFVSLVTNLNSKNNHVSY